jgi:hypothetical protein
MTLQRSEAAFRPILLIGAGRSGTNLIAKALGTSDELHNVYEQRYVWTKGMFSTKTDLRGPDDANEAVAGYVRAHFFQQVSAQAPGVRLVDKTPANALRLAFCLRVFPEAQIINVIRNPLDNIASRLVELQKAGRKVPGGDGPSANRNSVFQSRIKHARDLIRRGNIPPDRIPAAILDQLPEKIRILMTGQAARYAERVPGLAEIEKAEGTIAALCHQWRELVMSSLREGRKLGSDRYLEIAYEDVVQTPTKIARNLTDFVKLDRPQPVADWLCENAKAETIGNWRRRLTKAQSNEITTRLESEMRYLGMDVNSC